MEDYSASFGLDRGRSGLPGTDLLIELLTLSALKMVGLIHLVLADLLIIRGEQAVVTVLVDSCIPASAAVHSKPQKPSNVRGR